MFPVAEYRKLPEPLYTHTSVADGCWAAAHIAMAGLNTTIHHNRPKPLQNIRTSTRPLHLEFDGRHDRYGGADRRVSSPLAENGRDKDPL